MDSIKPIIASTVIAADSAKLALDALHTSYENTSQTWVFSLCDHLDRITKESLSITDYLLTIWSLLDKLATTVVVVVSNP